MLRRPEFSSSIAWNADGTALQFLNVAKFEREVCPHYFKVCVCDAINPPAQLYTITMRLPLAQLVQNRAAADELLSLQTAARSW